MSQSGAKPFKRDLPAKPAPAEKAQPTAQAKVKAKTASRELSDAELDRVAGAAQK